MPAPSFLRGDQAKIWLNGNTVRGLRAFNVPTAERSLIDIEELGQDFDYQDTGSRRWKAIPVEGNFLTGDATGQDLLRSSFHNDAQLTAIRLYVDEEDFYAPDTAADPISCLKVYNEGDSQVTRNGVVPCNFDMIVQGTVALFRIHMTTLTDVTVVRGLGSEDSVTTTAGDFSAAGFISGMTLLLGGSGAGANENKMYKIKTVAAKTLTLETEDVVTGVSDAAIELHGGSLYGIGVDS